MALRVLTGREAVGVDGLVRMYYRTEQTWVEHLAEGEAMEAGTAVICPELAEIWDANHVRDAALPPGIGAAEAVAGVEQLFARRGLTCGYWMMNPAAAEEAVRPLVEELGRLGYRRDVDEIYYLRKASGEAGMADVPGVRVIPARAAYRQARELAAQRARDYGRGEAQVVEAYVRHLDDPHYDALLALEGDRPVAALGVLAVGEVARIEGVYVAPSARGRGVGRMMMSRGLEICGRAVFRHVLLGVAADNGAAKRLYERAGFVKIGEAVRYYHARTVSAQ